MRLPDAQPMTDAEFEILLEEALGGIISSDTGISDAMDELIIRIATAPNAQTRDVLVARARELRTSEQSAP